MFCEIKVAQMAAYLLSQEGGRMAYLKLMKLMYLSEREYMRRYGESISGDRMVSMPHGPVLSNSLDFMNGTVQGSDAGWEKWIIAADNNELVTKLLLADRDEYDELTDAEIEVLNSVFSEFGHMAKWQIRDYTHTHCPEWVDPHGSSYPIDPKSIFLALGKSAEVAIMLADRMREQNQLDQIVSRLV
ncbi:Panacea domain-containing protein [Xenorhabdus cabanillasii]|uniref:Antitoxin SocA-like Panacea domain-containing protein n=1 Tax=Xenorhabdus cabanillasii JM26 TaxID=1427517 RepID=W1ILG4_9GAMM|nr:Panacea domain-containing protein [Xenorhabdus cabanillasii]PHM76661.1 phage-associated protein [Xenorhabdus cabanillasii JM26]CDL79284.1 conserved hypothetical protein [Xenorhabdus cabanillasii JM26]